MTPVEVRQAVIFWSNQRGFKTVVTTTGALVALTRGAALTTSGPLISATASTIASATGGVLSLTGGSTVTAGSVLEMVNAGLLEIVVVDDWKAAMWAQILPDIKVREDLAVREGGYVGWAFRKNSPQLRQAIDDFYVNFVKKQGVAEYRLKQYMRRIKQIGNNTDAAEYKRFQQTVALFEKYGKDYGFDPLMLAAQGFQESQLKQEARSRVGATQSGIEQRRQPDRAPDWQRYRMDSGQYRRAIGHPLSSRGIHPARRRRRARRRDRTRPRTGGRR